MLPLCRIDQLSVLQIVIGHGAGGRAVNDTEESDDSALSIFGSEAFCC